LITNKKKLYLLDIININIKGIKGIKKKIKRAIAPSLPYMAPPLVLCRAEGVVIFSACLAPPLFTKTVVYNYLVRY
jgi:hypothetical protein